MAWIAFRIQPVGSHMQRFTLALLALGLANAAWSAEPAAAPQPSPEQVVEQFRQELQAKRADIMAKGLTLTADQAAKFWPLFQQFQAEQDAIVDGQIAATQKYAEKFESLTDTDALEYVNALLSRDDAMNELRVAWLAKFQDVVPARVAARAIQLDRRLSQVAQVKVSSEIPLIP
jgi:Spy/CpxP family protein refolding chaperone